jgi:hypothetical protein
MRSLDDSKRKKNKERETPDSRVTWLPRPRHQHSSMGLVSSVLLVAPILQSKLQVRTRHLDRQHTPQHTPQHLTLPPDTTHRLLPPLAPPARSAHLVLHTRHLTRTTPLHHRVQNHASSTSSSSSLLLHQAHKQQVKTVGSSLNTRSSTPRLAAVAWKWYAHSS